MNWKFAFYIQSFLVLFKVSSFSILFSLYSKHSKVLKITKKSLKCVNRFLSKDIRITGRRSCIIVIASMCFGVWELTFYETEGRGCGSNVSLEIKFKIVYLVACKQELRNTPRVLAYSVPFPSVFMPGSTILSTSWSPTLTTQGPLLLNISHLKVSNSQTKVHSSTSPKLGPSSASLALNEEWDQSLKLSFRNSLYFFLFKKSCWFFFLQIFS